MKKKKSDVGGSSIFSLWEKASKAKKTNETTTPNQTIVEASSSHDQPENNLQLALVQSPPDEEREPESSRTIPNPILEDEETVDEEDEETQADLGALEHDPGKRIPISRYDTNDKDRVRRRYIEMGPYQPKNHKFPITSISGKDRRFCMFWFKEYPWVEYRVDKDAAFCFVCYLFKDKIKCPGGDSFVKKGFRNWHMKS
uniref:Uncharacterized protein n=1 Tax=Avena sativa TaxID=4498 RepID=A0ACD5TU08_AVESA